jgi:erythromycin esterase-like protein
VSYGPTAFGRQVTPDVPSAVILPACDGDVSDLQGQAYVDWSRDLADSDALRSAVLALGANHNYFNTEWTPGLAQAPARDDWWDPGDPVCGDEGSLRLSVEEQQQVGAAYTLALVRLTLEHDADMLPFLDGTKAKPASIGRAEVSVSPVGGASTLLYRPEAEGMPELLDGMTGRRCPGYVPWSVEDPSGDVPCGEGFWEPATPHWQGMEGMDTRPPPMALELSWSEPSAVVRFALGTKAKGLDLSRERTVDVRVANDPAGAAAEIQVRLRDTAGRSALLRTDLDAIEGWPGEEVLDRIQARTLRADLSSAGRVDLRRVAAVELVTANEAGRVWVLDIAAARPKVTSPESLDLPRLSVETVDAPEGGADGATTVDVSIRVEGRVDHVATVWAQVTAMQRSHDMQTQGFPIELRPGVKRIVATVPISFVGDDVWEQPWPGGRPFDGGRIQLASVRGALTGEYQGGVTTFEDEEPPVLSVDEPQATATEGQALEWTLRLSGPTAGHFYLLGAEPPDGEVAELDSDDVDQGWLDEQLWWQEEPITLPIDPPLPLSEIGRDQTGHGLPGYVFFEHGQTEVTVEVPLRFDFLEEIDEWMVQEVKQPWGEDPTIPTDGIRLVGLVPAHGATDGLPDWVASAIPITGTFGETSAEEAAIDAIVGDAPVVLAGELSWGAAQAVETTTGLIADLVERRDVGDVRYDVPLPSSVAAARYVAFGDGSADAAVREYPDELRRSAEAVAFLETMRAASVDAGEPLLVLGLDPGTEPAALVDLIEVHDPAVAATLACFDLDIETAGEWYLVPAGERESCRQLLATARDTLAVEAAASGRDESGFGSQVAHAASVALLAAETTAALDPASDGYDGDRASRRAEGLADGILAALEVSSATGVVAALNDLDAAVLRDVAEPRNVPASTPDEEPEIVRITVERSTGAVLADALGRAQVASVGVTAGSGEIMAYFSSYEGERWLSPQSLDRPARGSVERLLSGFGPDIAAFAVPVAGQVDLDSSLLMRLGIRDEYRSRQPDAWYVPVRASEAFDGLVHVRRMVATTLLGQPPWLEVGGLPVEVIGACSDWDPIRVEVVFDGGSFSASLVYDDDWVPWFDATAVVVGITYAGTLRVEEDDGWTFAGQLFSAEGGEATEIAGYSPYGLPGC